MVNHTTHSHFLALAARWLALLHCTSFTLNGFKQTIRTHNLSRGAAADLRLRPCGHRDRQLITTCNVEK